MVMALKQTRSDLYLTQRERIAGNVRHYRHRLGLTQKDMADFVGLAINTVYMLEHPERMYNAPLSTLCALAHALDVPVVALFEERAIRWSPSGKRGQRFLRESKVETNT
jgi:transcriptional regulator with XRE-family HTH domain